MIPLEWMPPLMFGGLVIFMLIGFPVAFSLMAAGLFFSVIAMSEGFFGRWSRRKSGKEKELDSAEELVKKAPAKSATDSSALDKTKEEIQTQPPVTLEDVEKSIDLHLISLLS